MTTPLIAPPEAQPSAAHDHDALTDLHDADMPATESLSRPFRLGLVGLGTAIGLFFRLLAANELAGFELDSQSATFAAAVASGLAGLGLLLMAAERDRFGPRLAFISSITALAWGALNWISPPFAPSVTVWSNPDQAALAVLGLGNGLLLAGIVSLAFVRRHPTLSVAATIVASVFALASNTVVLRDEWPAIVSLGLGFALILLAWDRSPRRELAYTRPEAPSRVSRAWLSLISVALCGTAIQLWISRTDIPRSVPALVVCGVLILGAFVTLVGVRRDIEQRETTLSEWTSWAREIRTNDFRAEMQNFESSPPEPSTVTEAQAPRPLSFPNLSISDEDLVATAPRDATGAVDTPASPHPVVPDVLLPDVVADAATATSLTADVAPGAPTVPATSGLGLPRIDTAPGTASTPFAAALPTPDTTKPAPAPAPTPQPSPPATGGAFSSVLDTSEPTAVPPKSLATLATLGEWLASPTAATRIKPLLVAVEAMSLDEFESLPPTDAAMATDEIGSFLADTMPDADLVSWIDGPYFIVAFASKRDAHLSVLNRDVRKSLKSTNGTLAFLRPGPDSALDEIVDAAVMALLQARQVEDRATGR